MQISPSGLPRIPEGAEVEGMMRDEGIRAPQIAERLDTCELGSVPAADGGLNEAAEILKVADDAGGGMGDPPPGEKNLEGNGRIPLVPVGSVAGGENSISDTDVGSQDRQVSVGEGSIGPVNLMIQSKRKGETMMLLEQVQGYYRVPNLCLSEEMSFLHQVVGHLIDGGVMAGRNQMEVIAFQLVSQIGDQLWAFVQINPLMAGSAILKKGWTWFSGTEAMRLLWLPQKVLSTEQFKGLGLLSHSELLQGFGWVNEKVLSGRGPLPFKMGNALFPPVVRVEEDPVGGIQGDFAKMYASLLDREQTSGYSQP